ncbi:hypothetical protein RI367_002567 [Sorochytrium milnesiophthora]
MTPLTALLVALATCVAAIQAAATPKTHEYTPVVIWHGMGDTCCNPQSMGSIIKTMQREMPGVFVHSIRIGASESDDKRKGFLDDINIQIANVCAELATVPELKAGFNAVGFSQGGLFLRAYVERCAGHTAPPVRTLVTIGSPHQGIADVPASMCKDQGVWCVLARQILQGGAYTSYGQHKVVQATYYKDPLPARFPAYVESSILLADINNEIKPSALTLTGTDNDGDGDNDVHKKKRKEYKERLLTVHKLVMVMFEKDTMIVPKESAWFGTWVDKGKLQPMRNTTLYTEDRIGLRTLDEQGKLAFLSYPTDHLQFGDADFVRDIVDGYLKEPHKSLPYRFKQQQEQ